MIPIPSCSSPLHKGEEQDWGANSSERNERRKKSNTLTLLNIGGEEKDKPIVPVFLLRNVS